MNSMDLPEYFMESELIELLNGMLKDKKVTKRTVESLVTRTKNKLVFRKVLGRRIFLKEDVESWFKRETNLKPQSPAKIKKMEVKKVNDKAADIFSQGAFS